MQQCSSHRGPRDNKEYFSIKDGTIELRMLLIWEQFHFIFKTLPVFIFKSSSHFKFLIIRPILNRRAAHGAL